MIQHHTIINQDPKQFDKDLNKFLNEIKPEALIGVDYTITVVPVAAPPVNARIQGLQQPTVQFVPFFAAFITFHVEINKTLSDPS